MADAPIPMSPLWWVNRLSTNLAKQAERAAFFNDYYTGEHPLPWRNRYAAQFWLWYRCDVVDGETLLVDGGRHVRC